MPDIQKTDLTKSSIVQIIHCILVGSVFCLPTRLLSIIASFSYIYILQGSVVTQLMFGGIFNNKFIASCPQNVTVKNFKNRLIFREDMDKSKLARFYGPRRTHVRYQFHRFFLTETDAGLIVLIAGNVFCL